MVPNDPNDVGGKIIIGVTILVAAFAARRAFGKRYITDERGERQRVIAWNRGQPVYDPKTWQQRIFEEVAVRRERRKWLIAGAFCVLGPVALMAWAIQNNAGILWGALGGLLLISFALPMSFKFIPALFQEIAYQLGYQGMQGAKVLDEQPSAQPGREVVETQKAHGDARLAGEDEAVALLNSKN